MRISHLTSVFVLAAVMLQIIAVTPNELDPIPPDELENALLKALTGHTIKEVDSRIAKQGLRQHAMSSIVAELLQAEEVREELELKANGGRHNHEDAYHSHEEYHNEQLTVRKFAATESAKMEEENDEGEEEEEQQEEVAAEAEEGNDEDLVAQAELETLERAGDAERAEEEHVLTALEEAQVEAQAAANRAAEAAEKAKQAAVELSAARVTVQAAKTSKAAKASSRDLNEPWSQGNGVGRAKIDPRALVNTTNETVPVSSTQTVWTDDVINQTAMFEEEEIALSMIDALLLSHNEEEPSVTAAKKERTNNKDSKRNLKAKSGKSSNRKRIKFVYADKN